MITVASATVLSPLHELQALCHHQHPVQASLPANSCFLPFSSRLWQTIQFHLDATISELHRSLLVSKVRCHCRRCSRCNLMFGAELASTARRNEEGNPSRHDPSVASYVRHFTRHTTRFPPEGTSCSIPVQLSMMPYISSTSANRLAETQNEASPATL